MNKEEAVNFLQKISRDDIHIVLLGELSEEQLLKIKEIGYIAFIRITAFGIETVVTHKQRVNNE